jgi:hypothetical protein
MKSFIFGSSIFFKDPILHHHDGIVDLAAPLLLAPPFVVVII